MSLCLWCEPNVLALFITLLKGCVKRAFQKQSCRGLNLCLCSGSSVIYNCNRGQRIKLLTKQKDHTQQGLAWSACWNTANHIVGLCHDLLKVWIQVTGAGIVISLRCGVRKTTSDNHEVLAECRLSISDIETPKVRCWCHKVCPWFF